MGIFGREVYAVVGRQTGHEYPRDAPCPQVGAKASGAAVAIVEKRAVAVQVWVSAFAEDGFHAVEVQARMQRCARRALHAVVGPQALRQALPRYLAKERLAGMGTGKAAVPSRMPVLGSYHQVEARLQLIKQR